MEKNWLDVDDYFTAFLVALALHGVEASPDLVRRSIIAAVRQREFLYGERPGALPASARPADGVFKISDLDKYQPERIWHGSNVLGSALGGRSLDAEDEGDDDD
jgi:hypothetical protein